MGPAQATRGPSSLYWELSRGMADFADSTASAGRQRGHTDGPISTCRQSGLAPLENSERCGPNDARPLVDDALERR